MAAHRWMHPLPWLRRIDYAPPNVFTEVLMSDSLAPQTATARPEGLNTLLILLAAALLAAIVVPFLPAGLFEPGAPVALERFRVVPDAAATTLFGHNGARGFFNFLFEGFASGDRNGAAVGLIALIFIIGGSFALVNETGAVERGLLRLVALSGGHPAWLLGSLTIAFSLGGAVFGMGEETIAFLVLLLPLIDRLGLPRESTVMATYMASQIGFATSWMNPFSVMVAQSVAGVPAGSGAPLRIVVWVLFTLAALVFTLHYALRHRRAGDGDVRELLARAPLRARDRVVLLAIVATVAWIVWGITQRGYYLPELAAQFFTLGLFCAAAMLFFKADTATDAAGLLARANCIAELFTRGVAQMVPVALVIAAAKGLLWLLGGTDPHKASVLNTLLFHMGHALEGWPPMFAAQGMFLFQSIFNVFVTSGSAQASITMPLMAGLGDIVGVSRQVAVLAFQLGDGVTNLIIPTSAVLMGAIGVAGVSWGRWLRAIWRFELILIAMAASAVAYAVSTGYT
jgi:uncharacterized ion transporter superfamily protein YfcC